LSDFILKKIEVKTTSKRVCLRIDEGGSRSWRFDDFSDLPRAAVARALNRLARAGRIQRISKGVYYHQLGSDQIDLQTLSEPTIFPAGLSAAHLLGFTASPAARSEVSTSAPYLSRKAPRLDSIVHPRRPAAWDQLSAREAAVLEFLRDRGSTSDLSAAQTVKRLLVCLSEPGWFEALIKVANSEPPRVRAMLGAIGQQLAKSEAHLQALRSSLNPLSRFDFGALSSLRYAREWQAKIETVPKAD
jgi:hypothetical protein